MRSPKEQERFLVGDRFHTEEYQIAAPAKFSAEKLALVLIALGVIALAALLLYDHGLEDTLSLVLYTSVSVTVAAAVNIDMPLGLARSGERGRRAIPNLNVFATPLYVRRCPL